MKRRMNPQRHDGRDYLTTAQTATRLGVKTETVYAYVSRGLLTSARIPAVRGSLFAVDEVEQLASREGARRVAGGSVERIRTQLTLLEDDDLYYRGKRATDLVPCGFERVAEFLWSGELPDEADFPASTVPVVAFPDSARLIDRLRVSVDLAAAGDPLRSDLSPRSLIRCAHGVLAAGVAGLGGGSDGRVAARLWPAVSTREPRPGEVDILDAALVLLADHDLAASTLAARVAASTRANLYAVVGAGLGAIDGPLHGTMAERAVRLFDGDPLVALGNAFRLSEPVPGFGHMLYQRRDPRAEYLLGRLRSEFPGPLVDAADVIVSELRMRNSTFPTSDFALALMTRVFDLRIDAAEAIFALARTAGWIAHAIEEYKEPPLRFRVPGVYVGVRPAQS
ncbi:MAG: citrate synthase [Nocardiaceae bacterium]|nr:citrate synthase [Nocardiaceae bacterium]